MHSATADATVKGLEQILCCIIVHASIGSLRPPCRWQAGNEILRVPSHTDCEAGPTVPAARMPAKCKLHPLTACIPADRRVAMLGD